MKVIDDFKAASIWGKLALICRRKGNTGKNGSNGEEN
jgi:hypothetical protein